MMLADVGADMFKIEPSPTGALRGSGDSPGPDEARALDGHSTRPLDKGPGPE